MIVGTLAFGMAAHILENHNSFLACQTSPFQFAAAAGSRLQITVHKKEQLSLKAMLSLNITFLFTKKRPAETLLQRCLFNSKSFSDLLLYKHYSN
ncbi:hypothetical protein GF343_05865 [Candidatus Woesearchaeota archaeon]|nr:hypothetical protein [Candidatus Woesearchaeota archaeon]